MKVQVCTHHPLNPKKSKACIERLAHMGHWITELDLPFVDDLNLAAWSLTNMALSDDISDEDVTTFYDGIKNDVLSKRDPETEELF